jgi:hypothetical protein
VTPHKENSPVWRGIGQKCTSDYSKIGRPKGIRGLTSNFFCCGRLNSLLLLSGNDPFAKCLIVGNMFPWFKLAGSNVKMMS